MTNDELNSMIVCAKLGDRAAKTTIINSVDRIVRSLASSVSHKEFSDAYQDGMLGALRAIDKYDPEQYSTQFSTYAYYWIRKYVLHVNKRDAPNCLVRADVDPYYLLQDNDYCTSISVDDMIDACSILEKFECLSDEIDPEDGTAFCAMYLSDNETKRDMLSEIGLDCTQSAYRTLQRRSDAVVSKLSKIFKENV